MCDVANSYKDGEVVWVKVSSRWWPGEVCNEARLPEGLIQTRRKKPLAIVKFFQEDTYEFVKDLSNLMKYDCAKKNDFIKKGMDLYRANNKHMLKFPLDVQTAEKLTGGDENIIDDDNESVERKKFNYSDLFGDQTVKKNKKGRKPGPKSTAASTRTTRTTNRKSPASTKSVNTTNKISPIKEVKRSLVLKKKDLRLLPNYKKDVPNHESKIMLQTKTSQDEEELKPYKCRLCDFTSTRQNVIVIHTKSHSNPTPLEIREPTKEILESTKIRGGKSSSKTRSKEMKQRLSKYSKTKYKVDSYIILDTSDNERDYTKPAFNRSRRTSDSSVEVILEMTTRRREPEINESNHAESIDRSSLEKDKNTDEGIRTKLLADWSDEGSECEEDDTNTKKVAQASNVADKSRESFTENSDQPTVPEPLRLADGITHFLLSTVRSGSSIDEKSSSSGAQEGRSSPRKYRNIPKKDRRDVVLKEFSNGDILTARSNSIKEVESTVVIEIDSDSPKPTDERRNSIKELESTEVIEIDSDSPKPTDDRRNSINEIESTVAIEIDSDSQKQSDEPVDDELICENNSNKTENANVSLEGASSVESSVNNDSEMTSKTENTALKPSTSCFDFQEEEEEDFLASIIKLKKKYLSPEKNKDIKEVVDQFKVETEKQDEQLSVDIENLLNSTKLPEIKSSTVTALSAKPSTSSVEIVPQEVRALPPKERGKRIFKSRNKSRYEDIAVSISTTTSTIDGKLNASPIVSSVKYDEEDTRKSTESNVRSSVHKIPEDITNSVNSAPEKPADSLRKDAPTTTEAESTVPDSTTDSPKDIISETRMNSESNDENDINSNENNKEDLNHEEQTSGALEAEEPVNDAPLAAAPEINSKSELEEVQPDNSISESGANTIAQSMEVDEIPQIAPDSSNYMEQEDNIVVAISHDNNASTDKNYNDENREQEPLETSSLITTKTQSELAVAEALISIPKTLTLNSPILELTEPLNSQLVEPKETELDTVRESNTSEEDKGPDERQKLSPAIDETNLTEIRETESTSNTESNSSLTEKDTQHFDTEKAQSGGKLNSVGTRKRRRAHMKITPRKRIVVPIIEKVNDMETKTEDRTTEQFERDDDDVSILKNTLSLHETLSIKISDKGSESDEVPRPQFSPLSPQGSPSKKHSDGEDSSPLGNISPLTPPQPRFSPLKQLSELESPIEDQAETVKPLSPTEELGEQEGSPKENYETVQNAGSPKEKTLREQYEENFVQKYIQDAMMFESSEVVKENVNDSENNCGNPATEAQDLVGDTSNAMEIRIEQQQVAEIEKSNPSKDAISEIRSFRLRRKNTRSSSNADKSPAQIETVVNKKHTIETFSMDVEENVLQTCGNLNVRNPKATVNSTQSVEGKGGIPDEEQHFENVPSASDCTDTNLEGENSKFQIEDSESHLDVSLVGAQQETAEKNIGVQTFMSSFALKEFRIPKKRKQAFDEEITSYMIEKTNNTVISPTPKEQTPPEKKFKLTTATATAMQKVPSLSGEDTIEKFFKTSPANPQTVVTPEISSPPVPINKAGTILNKRSAAVPKKLRTNSNTKPKPLPPAEPVQPKMTHQSSQIITTEGKEIGKDGKGNKFVIIKSGNEKKMVRRPETPPPPVDQMTSSNSMIQMGAAQNTDMKMNEFINKETALQAQSVQSFGTHIGNTRLNNPETLSVTTANQTAVSTPKTKNTPVRATRRRSTKVTSATTNFQSAFGQQVIEEESNLPGNQQDLMHSSAISLNKRVTVEKEKSTPATRGRRGGQTRATRNTGRGKSKKEELHVTGNMAVDTPTAVQTNEPQQQQQQHIQMQVLQQQLQNQQYQKQLQQQQQLLHQQQQHFQQHQIQQQLQIPQMQQQNQVRQQVQLQQHHVQHQMQLTQQQLQQQQLHQQQLQQQHLQQQQQLHQQQQFQQQQQQLQQQHLQQQQLQQQLAKKSTTKLSHSHEKCNSPVTLTASPQISSSQTEKTVLNVLPIAANSLPPDVEVDESEVASYVAVQAGDMTQPNVYYLCKQQGDEEGLIPVISQPFYLDQHNGTLVLPHQIPIETNEIEAEEKIEMEEQQIVVARTSEEEGLDQQRLIFNIGDNQLIIDYEMAVTLLNNSGGEDLVQLSANDQIFSIHVDTLATAFGLNRITLEKEEEQFLLSNMDIENQLQNAANQDIIAAALAGTEVYQQQSEIIGDGLVDASNVSIVEQGITFQPIDPQVSAVKATTNETNAILTQPPIMSALEIPPNKKKSKLNPTSSKINEVGLISQNLDESLAKIGVTTQSSVVPSSLELPITVTNPAIAPKTSSNSILLESIYASGLQQSSQMSPPISSAIANDQQELSYEILTSSSVQATQNNLNTRGQQIAEFNMVQHSGSVHTTSTYDDPTR